MWLFIAIVVGGLKLGQLHTIIVELDCANSNFNLAGAIPQFVPARL